MTAYRFILNDTRATLYGGVTELATVSADAFAQQFFSDAANATGLLPPAVRWVNSAGTAVIVERPPAIHTVWHCERAYQIPVPWTVWAMQFMSEGADDLAYLYSLNIHWRPSPLAHSNDQLYYPILPNIDTRGGACYSCPDTSFSSLGEAITSVIGAFWDAPFNNDFDGILLNVQPFGHLLWRHVLEHLEKMSLTELLETEMTPMTRLNEADTLVPMTVGALISRLDKRPEYQSTFDFFAKTINKAKRWET